MATSTAVFRSASSSTTSGFLPPISNCTRAPWAWADIRTLSPTDVDPVNDTLSTSGWLDSGTPTPGPSP